MILHGNDLIISSTDGTALAASKSCTISVEAEQIETSDPDQGDWRNYLTGRKSWTLTTNHLVKASTDSGTPLKDMIGETGKTYKLTFSNRKNGKDTVSGTAIIKSVKITATRGNLAQGSFSWQGNGKLE